MPSPYEPLNAVVAAVTDLTPSFRRVTFRGPELTRVAPLCLDRRIKLLLPRHAGDDLADLPRGDDWYARWQELDERPALRTYTARAVRPELGEVDVDVVRHGTTGPAGRWIESVRPGDALRLVAPIADADTDQLGIAWRPGEARDLLVVGDATAVPAVANILAALPDDATGTALVEVPTSRDDYPLPAPVGMTVRVLPCDGAIPGSRLEAELHALDWPSPEAAPSGSLPLTIKEPLDQLEDRGSDPAHSADSEARLWQEADPAAITRHYAWLAGEAGAITRLRRHLVKQRGCSRRCVSFMGYWRAGQPES